MGAGTDSGLSGFHKGSLGSILANGTVAVASGLLSVDDGVVDLTVAVENTAVTEDKAEDTADASDTLEAPDVNACGSAETVVVRRRAVKQ